MDIAIQPTHHLPFKNAVITARAVSGSTDLLEFHDAYYGSLGYELRTNSAGFVCSTWGTPYSEGIFVDKEAIITATFGDGSSTSWYVNAGSDISVCDGELYGRVLPDDYTGGDYVLVDGEKRKRLFTANQENNSELSLTDLADVPHFTRWKDDQQIETLDFGNLNYTQSVTVGIQTKTIILRSNGSTPREYPNYFKVVLHATLTEDGASRFGRNVAITNSCSVGVVICNSDNSTACRIAPGCTMILSEIYPNAQSGSEFGGQAHYTPCNDGSHAITNIPSQLVSITSRELVINDNTPDVLVLTNVSNISFNYSTAIDLKTSELSKPRIITIIRGDTYNGTLEIKFDNFQQHIGFLRTTDSMTIYVASTYVKRVDTANKPIIGAATPYMTNMQIAPYYDTIMIDCGNIVNASSELHDLIFSTSDNKAQRIEFVNVPKPTWFRIRNTDNLVCGQFCVPKNGGGLIVQNTCGVVTIVKTMWNVFEAYQYQFDNTSIGGATYTLDIKLNIGDFGTKCYKIDGGGHNEYAFGGADGTKNLVIMIPIADGETSIMRITVDEYFNSVVNTIAEGSHESKILFCAGGANDKTEAPLFVVSKSELVGDDHKKWINSVHVPSQQVQCMVTRVGDELQFTQVLTTDEELT